MIGHTSLFGGRRWSITTNGRVLRMRRRNPSSQCNLDCLRHETGLRDSSAPRHRGVDLISDVLPFGRLWYDRPDNAIGYAMHNSRSHDAVIRVYNHAGKVIETHEHKGDFKEP